MINNNIEFDYKTMFENLKPQMTLVLDISVYHFDFPRLISVMKQMQLLFHRFPTDIARWIKKILIIDANRRFMSASSIKRLILNTIKGTNFRIYLKNVTIIYFGLKELKLKNNKSGIKSYWKNDFAQTIITNSAQNDELVFFSDFLSESLLKMSWKSKNLCYYKRYFRNDNDAYYQKVENVEVFLKVYRRYFELDALRMKKF